MTKADIVKRVTDRTGISKEAATEAVEQLFELMKATLSDGEPLKIHGFGSFNLIRKGQRLGRNPRTGDEVVITARQVVTFRPSELLKTAMNEEPA